jgi:putative ABC transport system permease protein
MRTDLRWAIRGIRGRGWSATLSVALLAAALTASTLVFSSADALIFNRAPYPEADRLVTPRTSGGQRAFEELRRQTDVFTGISGHQPSATFLNSPSGPEEVETAFVTPGLFETLGVLPDAGRPLVEADRLSTDPTFAVIADDIARRYFGSAEASLGKTLATPDRPLTVVGVMPGAFRYPNGRVKIWRALDFERLERTFPSMTLVARLAPGVTPADAGGTLATRLPALVPKGRTTIELNAIFGSASAGRATTMRVLLGAALCLLLAACANVANLELANGLRRARTFSVQMALGASRASLVRVALLEGALLTALAAVVAAALAGAGGVVLTAILPETIALGGVNPIDVDWRALGFLIAVASVVWLLSSLPVVLYASKSSLLTVLKQDGRGVSVSRAGAVIRRAITAVEVALAVVLLAGGVLYLRTYAGLIGVETGLDTRGVVSLGMTMPLPTFSGTVGRSALEQIVERLAKLPGVVSVSKVPGAAPPGNAYTMDAAVEVSDGTTSGPIKAIVTAYSVDGAFFTTVGLTPRHGRTFDANDPPTVAVISETFARRLWGESSPLGRSFRLGPRFPWTTVVGVVPHVRTNRDDLGGPSATAFSYFRPTAPPAQATAPVVAPVPAAIVNAPTGMLPYSTATLLVRLADPSRSNEVLSVARATEPRAGYVLTSLDAAYAARHAETRMATSIISAFAVVAFVIAVAGIFGVITFLVQSRTREIGIRMALGAGARDVGRMVLRSSLSLVVVGVVIGVSAAILASRFVASQLFGVSPTDPQTYLAVGGAVVLSATLATWHPARRATRVDPAVTLRAE